MAEQELPADAGQADDVVLDTPPEDDTQQQPKTVEDFARERGWKPKEEFSGPEEDWRPAEDFIAFGMDRNKNLIQDVKQLRETTERMARTQAELTAQAVDRARAEERSRWENVHREAVEQGDHSAAVTAVQKIAELAQPAPRQANADPTVENFIRENSWFHTDPAAHAVAVTISNQFAHLPVHEQLEKAREAVHRRFPEYAPQQAKPPAQVRAPADRVTRAPQGRKKGFADLPPEAQRVARDMAEKGTIKSVDAYVEQYFGTGAVA